MVNQSTIRRTQRIKPYWFADSVRWVAVLCRVMEVKVYIPAHGHTSLGYNNRSDWDAHESSARPKSESRLGQAEESRRKLTNLTIDISPVRHSRTSRTKKSMFGPPIPMLMIEIGTPL
jgi:hypothetical protein